MRSYWSRGTSSLDEILAMLTEASDLGEELGNTEIIAEAMAWRVPTFVALCDLDSARREVAALLATAEQTAQPFMLHVAEHYGSAIALCDGRLDEAEARAQRSHEWSRLFTGRDAAGVYGIQMFGIRREQGRLAELAPVIRILAADASRGGPWRPGLVSVLVELGMEDEARRELARVVAEGLDPFRESLWLAALTYLTDACAALGDEATAAILYPELEPLAGANVMIGHLVSCYGAADRYLGMLAATLGEAERARGALRARHGAQPAHGRGDVGRPHRLRVRPPAADARAGRARPRPGAARRGGARSPSASGCRRSSAASGAWAPPRRRPAAPDGLSAARGPDPVPRGPGPQQPRDRHDAVHQRAHRRQPHPQHPAQDRAAPIAPRPPPTLTGTASSRHSAPRYDPQMPLYVIERTFADQLDLTTDDVRLIDEINADEGVRWLFSFLSADRRRTYCLYEAPSPDAIVAAAQRANIPSDVVVEVGPASLELSGRLRDWAAAQVGVLADPRTPPRGAPKPLPKETRPL